MNPEDVQPGRIYWTRIPGEGSIVPVEVIERVYPVSYWGPCWRARVISTNYEISVYAVSMWLTDKP